MICPQPHGTAVTHHAWYVPQNERHAKCQLSIAFAFRCQWSLAMQRRVATRNWARRQCCSTATVQLTQRQWVGAQTPKCWYLARVTNQTLPADYPAPQAKSETSTDTTDMCAQHAYVSQTYLRPDAKHHTQCSELQRASAQRVATAPRR